MFMTGTLTGLRYGRSPSLGDPRGFDQSITGSRQRSLLTGLTLMLLIWAITPPISAQTPETAPAPPGHPATQPQATPQWPTTMPSSQTIEKQLINQLEPSPVVQPTHGRPAAAPASNHGPPTDRSAGLDSRVLGVAPGQTPPKLRREGAFIVNRRGRVVQSPNGHDTLFVFEADSDAAPEPPMILSACQMLENMEQVVRERGDKVVFILSGQVLIYRGVNYLLPTMMKLAIDHGNLNQ